MPGRLALRPNTCSANTRNRAQAARARQSWRCRASRRRSLHEPHFAVLRSRGSAPSAWNCGPSALEWLDRNRLLQSSSTRDVGRRFRHSAVVRPSPRPTFAKTVMAARSVRCPAREQPPKDVGRKFSRVVQMPRFVVPVSLPETSARKITDELRQPDTTGSGDRRRGLSADHHRRRLGVAADHFEDDIGVRHAQPPDARDPQPRDDDATAWRDSACRIRWVDQIRHTTAIWHP